MRPIGFSTGALAHADFRRGLAMLSDLNTTVVELSALRLNELRPLVESLDDLDLHQFEHIAIHAPSRFSPAEEEGVVELLEAVSDRSWPIILHPDTIHNQSLWRRFGPLLCIENMDKRKPGGRSALELERVFAGLPEASFCFDIGHARQFDSTMTEAYLLLRDFGDRLRQVHVSEVNTSSRHDALSYASVLAFQEVAHMIPEDVPIVLETPTVAGQLEQEVEMARKALPLEVAAITA